MNDIDAIKRVHFEQLRSREVVLLVRHDYGYQVEHWSPDGMAPTSDYDTAQEAAARACQLLKLTDPVTPQSWPEVAQIGGGRPTSPPRR